MQATYYTHMGSDDMVVDMARASFGKLAGEYSPERNASLIRFLARGMSSKEREELIQRAVASDNPEEILQLFKDFNAQKHWAPLAHPQVTLFMEVPIYVARQDFKHIVGFVRSETSRRYVFSEPEFFTPCKWREKPEGSIKQGSGGSLDKNAEYSVSVHVSENRLKAHSTYQYLLETGVAPEQARGELPQSMLTTYYTTGSLAAWARAFNQRVDPHAQQEIQDLYRQVGEIIEPLFPVSWAALTE